MRLKQVFCVLALGTVLSVLPTLSVSSTETTETTVTTTSTETTGTTVPTVQNEFPRIRLVGEPGPDSDEIDKDEYYQDVYFYKDGNKQDPETLTWVDSDLQGSSKALKLDGETEYIRVATARVKKLTEFTLSMWVKWDGKNDGPAEERLLRIYNDADPYHRCLTLFPSIGDIDNQLNGMQLILRDQRIETVKLYHKVTDNISSALSANEWHHIAVTLSDEAVALYVDGLLYGEQQLENFSLAAMGINRFVIGCDDIEGTSFQGLIDKAHLFETAYDANQIALLAQHHNPREGVTPTTKPEVLATAPYVAPSVPASDATDAPIRVLGMSPLTLAILGCCVVAVILLSLVLNFNRKNNPKQPEEDHP